MTRKVFMSVLGTSLYKGCTYFLNDKSNAVKTRFVQDASIRLLCKEEKGWGEGDQIIIFTTDNAFKLNYSKDISKRYDRELDKDVSYVGLEKVLEDITLKIPYKNQPIKDGNSEEEIWEIFETIYAELHEEDEIYFDITHSFRYLPMLLMNLLSYAELLKKTKIKSITYGNYEVSRDNGGYAPIMDLLPLVLLKDWSIAVNNFERFGEVGLISSLCQDSLRPILKEAKGKDIVAKSVNSFSKDLPKFVKNIQTCRGKEIISGELAKSLMNRIENIEETSLPPFNPIFSRLKLQLNRYANSNNVRNGLAAVGWCVQNGLIQQGFTLLQETVISLICESEDVDFTIEKYRNIVSQAFKIKFCKIDETAWKGECSEDKNKDLTHKLLNNYQLNLLVKEYNTLTQLRNDINHAGMLNGSGKAENFGKNLEDLYCSITGKLINL